MINSKKWLQQHEEEFTPFYNRTCTITFIEKGVGEIIFPRPALFVSVSAAPVGTLTNKPTMRKNTDGVRYTPACMKCVFDVGDPVPLSVSLAIEDLTYTFTLSSLVFHCGTVSMRLTWN